MRTLIQATAVTLALSLTSLYAGSGHSHGNGHSHSHQTISKTKAQTLAKAHLVYLINQKKIDNTWSNISIKDTYKKKFQHAEEWVVNFYNQKMQEQHKQTLYLFISLEGKITGANYTGK